MDKYIYVVTDDDFYLNIMGIFDDLEGATKAAKENIDDEWDCYQIHRIKLNEFKSLRNWKKSITKIV